MSIKRLLLFTDLEGTLLRESDGKYDSEQMYNFLSRIDKLQRITGYSVNLHIVSPMMADTMKRVIDRIDGDIRNYNKIHRQPEVDTISLISGATVSPEHKADECYAIDQRLMPMPKEIARITDASYGKEHYVRMWTEAYENKDILGMIIYCGNGRNDIPAMKYVKNEKKGFIICPKNSKTEIRSFSNYVSDKTDIIGVTEGLDYIIDKISQKGENSKQEDIIEK